MRGLLAVWKLLANERGEINIVKDEHAHLDADGRVTTADPGDEEVLTVRAGKAVMVQRKALAAPPAKTPAEAPPAPAKPAAAVPARPPIEGSETKRLRELGLAAARRVARDEVAAPVEEPSAAELAQQATIKQQIDALRASPRFQEDAPGARDELMALYRQLNHADNPVLAEIGVREESLEKAGPGTTWQVALPDLPEGGVWDPGLTQPLLDEAMELELAPNVVEGFFQTLATGTPPASMEDGWHALVEQLGEAEAGPALDDARWLVLESGRVTPAQRAWLEETGWGDDPRAILAAAEIGKQLRADLARVQAVRRDPQDPLNDDAHPDHARRLKAYRKDYQRVYGKRPLFTL